MKSILPYSFLLFFLWACTGGKEDKTITSENDMDAARNFIRAALDGRYDDARTLIVPDSLNKEYLDVAERSYKDQFTAEDKRAYREAQIQFFDTRKLNDSTTIAVYANSFRQKKDSLKIVQLNGKWLVDFKYTFPRKDSIPK